MAFANVNPLASIWRHAGLRYILQDRDWLAQEEPVTEVKNSSTVAKPVSVAEKVDFNKNAPRPAKAWTATEKQPEEKDTAGPWIPVRVEKWPLLWQQRLYVSKNGLIAWTYGKLLEDLSPTAQTDLQARAARGNFMRKLFNDLGQKQGTHTFWPISMSIPPAQIDHDYFWSGLHALGSRAVVLMGSEAATFALPGKRLQPLMSTFYRNCLVWVIWDIDRLLAEKNNYARVLAFLRSSIRTLGLKS